MDYPQRDALSETTLPSEPVDIRSNLSTNANRSGSDDPILQDAPKPPQRSSEYHLPDIRNYPIHSQRQVHHRTQSLDQINNQIPIHSSAPPILNQSQQMRKDLNLGVSERKLELKTFDQDWQNNLKQEQQERQKYNELIYHNNEPLLSQKSQINQHCPNELLLSPKHSKSQASQSAKQSQPSKQVNYKRFGVSYSQIVNEEFDSKSNKSSVSNHPINGPPLFQMGIKQDTQSNLLNFGFVRKPKTYNEVNQTESKHQFEVNFEQVHPADSVQQPMDIQRLQDKIIQNGNSHSNTCRQISNEVSIKIYGCENDLVNSTSKNNDIYGLKSHHSNQKLKGQLKEQYTQYNEQESNIPQQQQQEIVQANLTLSLQEIVQQMQNICNGDSHQFERSQQGVRLLQRHIDLLFLKPLSSIGEQILKDGIAVILLIKIILLKQTDSSRKQILQKYLILTLVSQIQKHHHQFIQYQQSVSKSRTFSNLIHHPNESKQRGESLNGTKITMNESINPNQSYNTNQSVFAQDGSIHNSIQKSPRNNYENEAQLKVPVKRTLRNRAVSPISGKVTRKTRYKSNKRKGKTTTKKNSKVKFQQQSNQHSKPIISHQRQLRSRNKSKSVTKSQANNSSKKQTQKLIKEDSIAKDVINGNFGSKFTFVFQENKDLQKQLVQRRVSQRLAGKRGSLSKSDQSLDQRKSSKKKVRLSSKKKYEEEQLNIDYIKDHLRQIRIKTSLMQKNFAALTPYDRQIVQLIKESNQIEEQEQEQSLSASPIQQEYNQIVEDTRSITTSQGNSKMRLQQFKKNLSKYKVSDFPIVINRIVDPDINNHGIYALIQLGKLSQVIHHSKYALTPTTTLATACKRHIEQDLKQAKKLVDSQKDNIAYLNPTIHTLELIAAQKQRRRKAIQ